MTDASNRLSRPVRRIHSKERRRIHACVAHQTPRLACITRRKDHQHPTSRVSRLRTVSQPHFYALLRKGRAETQTDDQHTRATQQPTLKPQRGERRESRGNAQQQGPPPAAQAPHYLERGQQIRHEQRTMDRSHNLDTDGVGDVRVLEPHAYQQASPRSGFGKGHETKASDGIR